MFISTHYEIKRGGLGLEYFVFVPGFLLVKNFSCPTKKTEQDIGAEDPAKSFYSFYTSLCHRRLAKKNPPVPGDLVVPTLYDRTSDYLFGPTRSGVFGVVLSVDVNSDSCVSIMWNAVPRDRDFYCSDRRLY